jgi:hypothetical protein
MKKLFTVIVKKWFDKINGNTYHSVRCIRHSDREVITGPFQYGYGEHYKQTALEVMYKNGWLPGYIKIGDGGPIKPLTEENLYSYERENNYPIIWDVSDGLKRDCVANGEME